MTDWPFGLLRKRAYGVIYCDPPWAFRGYVSDGVPQQKDEQHYDTMTKEELAELPVAELAANDCALLMWSIASHTPQAFWLAEQWGFKFASRGFCWAKTTMHADKKHVQKILGWNLDRWNRKLPRIANPENWHMGMGHSSRRNPEDCWLFTRGSPKRLDKGVRELIVSPVREHSRKPDEVYDRIERLFGGPYCELFSRTSRPNWSAWGNQEGKFDD